MTEGVNNLDPLTLASICTHNARCRLETRRHPAADGEFQMAVQSQ